MSKKILIHSLIFSPDGVSTAYLYNDIALKFQKAGYEVSVLSTTPHFNLVKEQLEKQPLKWKVWGVCKQSDFNGIKVIHIPQKKFKSTLLRLIGFAYWHLIAFICGLFEKKVDVILSPSPPLTIGVINIWLAKIKGCKVVYNVQEIYPDILKKKDGVAILFLKKIERYVYNNSDVVTTIDQVFYDVIAPRFKDNSKLHIIPNFVDVSLYNPTVGKQKNNELDKGIFPITTSIKLLYAGNIGFAQDWDPIISLAIRTKEKNIEYFIIGEGVQKSYLEQRVNEFCLNKVHIIPYQPRNLMPAILEYSDLPFIFMSPEMDKQGFPSKVYTIMACGKPLLICSSKDTPIVNFLEPLNCAKLITEKKYDKKIDEMYEWITNISIDELNLMGTNGLSEISNRYTNDIVTDQYLELINLLLLK